MALYVKCSNPAQIWAGSNINIPFDGATHVALTAYNDNPLPADGNPVSAVAAADITWTLLNAPEGTTFNQAWFVANNGGTLVGKNPLASGSSGINAFIPDKAGTWLFRCTNTVTSESVDVVISCLQQRTGIRVPSAGETSESDTDTQNHNYPTLPNGSPGAMGWAKDRNYALELFDELITSAGVQLFYFSDGGLAPAPWGGTLKAGAAVALSGSTHLLKGDAITAGVNKVPVVNLADGNTHQDCVGLVLCGWEVPSLVPDAPKTGQRTYPRTITTTNIANNSLVLVSRTGAVSAAAAGILNLAGIPLGEILYLSATPGILQTGTDRFSMLTAGKVLANPQTASTVTTYVVPVAMTVDQQANGSVAVVPSEYWGGSSTNASGQCFRYKGISDFRGLRVGGPESTAVAGEMRGAIEMVATCKESGGLAVGDICMLYPDTAGTTNTAYKGNAYWGGNLTLVPNQVGIVGVCVEVVALDAVGHFVIYGPAKAKLSTSAQTESSSRGPAELFVGSETSESGDQSGIGVLFSEVGNKSQNKTANRIIPVGAVVTASGMGSPATIMVGKGTTEGYIKWVSHGIVNDAEESTTDSRGQSAGAWTPNVSSIDYTDGVATFNTKTEGYGDSTRIKLAGTGADDSLAEVNIFESKVPGTALVVTTPGGATALTSLMGLTSTAWAIPGATLVKNSATTAYTTFSLDNRLLYADPTDWMNADSFSNQNEIYLKIYGYTTGDAPDATLFVRARFNADSLAALPTSSANTLLSDYPYVTELINLEDSADSVYSQEVAAATTYRGFGIKCALTDRGTWAGASNHCAPETKPNLGLLSPQTTTNTVTPASPTFGGLAKEFQRLIETVDIEIINSDTSHDFIITEVVLQSRRRITGPTVAGNNIRTGYRLSYYESSYPAYAYLNYDVAGTADGVFAVNIKSLAGAPAAGTDGTGKARTRGLVGTPNYVTAAGTVVRHNMYGFIPTDPRIGPGDVARAFQFTVKGKLSCSNPSTATIGLKLEIVGVVPGTDLDKSISSAAGVITVTDSVAVGASNPATGQIYITDHLFEFTEIPNANIIGYWFKVTRTDFSAGTSVITTDAFNLNGTEDFWLMTNVRLQHKFPSGSSRETVEKIPENIYEQHIPATSLIDVTTGAFHKYINTDVSGATLTQLGGANSSLKFNAVLDERYDDKSGLSVDVLLALDASGDPGVGTHQLGFRLQTGYKNCQEVIIASGVHPVDSEIYDNRTYDELVANTGTFSGNNIRYYKASFFIPADQVWSNPADERPGVKYNSPNVNSSRDKGILKFLLSRIDVNAYNVCVLGVSVRGHRANKTKLSTTRPERIGGYSGTTGHVLTYPYTDSRRVVDVSIQRETLKFCVPSIFTQGTLATTNFGGSSGGVSTVPVGLPDTNAVQLLTPYLSALVAGASGPRNFNAMYWGHLITRNFAVTKVSGWLGQYDQAGGSGNLLPLAGGTGATSQIRLDLWVSEIPSRTSDAGLGPGGVANTQTFIYPKHLGASTNQVSMPGVEGLPMTFFTNAAGVIDWTPDSSNDGVNSAEQSKVMPKVLLPSAYSTLPANNFFPWQLGMTLTNVTGVDGVAANLYPIGEISIEIAILPDIQHNNSSRNECSVGGAPSSGEGF